MWPLRMAARGKQAEAAQTLASRVLLSSATPELFSNRGSAGAGPRGPPRLPALAAGGCRPPGKTAQGGLWADAHHQEGVT